MNIPRILPALPIAAGYLLTVGQASAAAVIYEPFNYTAGTINGTQGGATGTTGNWTQTQAGGGSGQFGVVSPGLSFTGLSTTGGAVKRTSANGGSEISIGISTAAQTILLVDNSTIYFSLLMRNDRFSVGNDNLTFVIGTGAFDVNGPDGVNPTITGGEGFGVHMDARNPADSTMDIYGYSIDGGAAAQSAGKIDNGTSVNTFIVLGRIDWLANGSNDTMTLWNVTDPTAFNPASASFATMTADLNQSLFDTLAIADRQVGTIDEIRFGTSFSDVGVTAIPEPSAAHLGGLGLLALLRRRRAC